MKFFLCGKQKYKDWRKLVLFTLGKFQSVTDNKQPSGSIDKLQKVQNAAARAKKTDHIHSILETLHWLPVTHHIQYKISTICFNSISGTAPQYLSDLLQPYTPARQLWSASNTWTFVNPRVNTKKLVKDLFLTVAHLLGTICLKCYATLILPPLLKPPSRHTCLIIISKLFFTAVPLPLSDAWVCAWVCVSVCVCWYLLLVLL